MASQYNITIDKGSKFELLVEWTQPDLNDPDVEVPKDLTGWSARAQVRERHDSADPPLLDFQSGAATTDPHIVLGDVEGTIKLVCPAAASAAITQLNGVWDLELTDPADATNPVRLLEGAVQFSPEVTR